jgi:hypothetical protein
MESFRRNLSENIFSKTGIFQNGTLGRNLSENIFSKTGIFQNGIFQKESFRKGKESFRKESFIKNLLEGIFQKRLYDQIVGSKSCF